MGKFEVQRDMKDATDPETGLKFLSTKTIKAGYATEKEVADARHEYLQQQLSEWRSKNKKKKAAPAKATRLSP